MGIVMDTKWFKLIIYGEKMNKFMCVYKDLLASNMANGGPWKLCA